MAERLFKFLRAGAIGPFSGFRWSTPREGSGAGDWVQADGSLQPCRHGIHVCRPADLPYWMNDELYEVDVGGARVEHFEKVVVERARLRARIDEWPELAWAFAEECIRTVRAMTVRELSLSGQPEAAELERCDDLVDAGRAATEAAQRRPDRPAQAVDFLGFLGDAVGYAVEARGRPAVAATIAGYIAAHAADRATPEADVHLPPGVSPFELERRRQAEYLTGAFAV